MAQRYYRLALVADPPFGTASYSWRVAEALLSSGHTVFYFSPVTHPDLFSSGGDASGRAVDLGLLARFFEVQRLDFVMLADGVAACPFDAARAPRPLVLASDARQLSRSLAALPGIPAAVLAPAACAALCRPDDCFSPLEPAADRGLLDTPLANGVIYEHRPVLCLQDATPERIDTLARIRDLLPHDAAIRCFGAGWPDAWTGDISSNDLLYALKSRAVLIRFDGSADTAYCAALCETCGGTAIDAAGLAPSEAAARLEALCGGDSLDSPGAPGSPDSSEQAANRSDGYLEERLEASLAGLADQLAARAETAPGGEDPRVIVTVLGYFGMGNFGDEYILALIDRRLRARYPGSSVVVVGENRRHTLEKRGLYAIELCDKPALDRALAHSSAALVVAGLLFDQGIRWSMGRAELISSPRHTTIPGITSYALLAALNRTPVVYYGIGAGPLDIAAGRDMVALSARIGATFIARDRQAADLLRSCGIEDDRVLSRADTAFLGKEGVPARSPQVDAWLERAGFDPAHHRIVAVSLRDYEGLPADFSSRVARALDAVQTAHEDVRFAFCILDPSDERLSSQVVESMAAARHAAVFDAHDAIELLDDLLGRVYGGLSMRYHCSLLINRSGMPCVGLDYLPKVASLYHDTGCDDLLLGLDASNASIERALASMLEKHGSWCATVGEATARLHALSSQAEEELYAVIDHTWPGKQGRVADELFFERESADERDARALERRLERERQRTCDLEAQVASLDDELRCIRQSVSFRLGRALTSLVRAVRDTLRR